MTMRTLNQTDSGKLGSGRGRRQEERVAGKLFALVCISLIGFFVLRFAGDRIFLGGIMSEDQEPTPRSRFIQCSEKEGLRKVESEFFSLCIPKQLETREVPPDDSIVWRYASKEMELTLDLGGYSEKPWTYAEEPNYREQEVQIDGRKATLCVFGPTRWPTDNLRYMSAAYFSEIGLRDSKLAMVLRSSSQIQQTDATAIFSSLKFKPRLTPTSSSLHRTQIQ
jgi:hypothetical protein